MRCRMVCVCWRRCIDGGVGATPRPEAVRRKVPFPHPKHHITHGHIDKPHTTPEGAGILPALRK